MAESRVSQMAFDKHELSGAMLEWLSRMVELEVLLNTQAQCHHLNTVLRLRRARREWRTPRFKQAFHGPRSLCVAQRITIGEFRTKLDLLHMQSRS